MAFFQSGQVLLAAGLLLVLGAQIAGDWLYEPLFQPFYELWQLGPPAIVAELWGQYLALALVLAGTYAYFYSDIVVRRRGLVRLPGRVHAALGRNAGDRTGCRRR